MSEREILLKKIIDEFSILENKIDKHNNLNLTDINLFSEDFFASILNIIFRYNLKPFKKINYPAIDLGDKENSIAFQITSTKTKKKIQKTLNGFKNQNLHLEFIKLKILVLGKKQKLYKNLEIDEALNFNSSKDIIDINDLLKNIKDLPSQKMQKILDLFKREFHKQTTNSNSSLSKLNRNLKLRKRIENDLVKRLSYQERNMAIYEPYIKFLYYDIIIRSEKDIHFPETDDTTTTGCSSWFKTGIYDFYENGLEMIEYGGTKILMDQEGYWDIAETYNDPRLENYELTYATAFLRVPYDYIINYEMEVDPVYGLPTFYIKYNSQNCPFEEIVYGTRGDSDKKQKRKLFDKNKRRNLK
jgi:hypothetical protein